MKRFLCLHLLESQGNQCEQSIVYLDLLILSGSDRDFPGSSNSHSVLEFKNYSFGRFLSDATDFGESGDISTNNRCFELRYSHTTQDCQSELRSNSTDVLQEQAKEIPLGRVGKPK